MKMKNGVKREREKQNGFKSKEERCEQIQADHELFLQAFESKNLFISLNKILIDVCFQSRHRSTDI